MSSNSGEATVMVCAGDSEASPRSRLRWLGENQGSVFEDKVIGVNLSNIGDFSRLEC